MALNITYWGGAGNPNLPGLPISSESLSISGTSGQSAATPVNAVYVSVVAGEATRFAYGTNPTADTTSALLSNGERFWLPATAGWKIAGIAG